MKVGDYLFCLGRNPYLYRGEVYKVSKVHYTKPLVQVVASNGKAVLNSPMWIPLSNFIPTPKEHLYDVGDVVKIMDVTKAASGLHSHKRVATVIGIREGKLRTESYLLQTEDGHKVWFYYTGIEKYIKPVRSLPEWF